MNTSSLAASARRRTGLLLAGVVLLGCLGLNGYFLASRLFPSLLDFAPDIPETEPPKPSALARFESLFNGKDLAGWETHPDQPGGWMVEDGCLVGRSANVNHLFTTRDDYENVHLRARVRIKKGGRAGIFFRSTFGFAQQRFPDGYEARILPGHTRPDVPLTGSSPPFTKIVKRLTAPDEWFTLEVIARGNHLLIKVNGAAASDFIDKANTRRKGRMVLQAMTDNNVKGATIAQFQSIEIKELPSFPAEVRKHRDGKPDAEWLQQHEEFVDIARKSKARVLFLGDSLTDFWRYPDARPVWDEHFAPLEAENFGIGGDRIEHLLWRIENGELEGIKPRVVVLLIGTNNLASASGGGIAGGVTTVVETIRDRSPQTRVLLLALFPRAEKGNWRRAKIAAVNQAIAKLGDGRDVRYLDIGSRLTGPEGALDLDILPDALHLSGRGYAIWAEAVTPVLKEMLSP